MFDDYLVRLLGLVHIFQISSANLPLFFNKKIYENIVMMPSFTI